VRSKKEKIPLSDRNDLAIADLIRERVQSLCAVFHRKESEALEAVAVQHLGRFDSTTLRRAFNRLETDIEKFPSIRQMRSFCVEEMPSEAWQYNYERVVVKDPEGKLVDATKDPKTGEILYRPQDCTEGRIFLAALRALAAKKAL